MKILFYQHLLNIERSKKNRLISIRVMLLLLLTFLTISAWGDDTILNMPKKKVVNSNPGGTYKGHEWIDLGLPSGVMWASCNIGANTPEAYGDYFAWGETTTKKKYTWSTYKWGTASNKLTKYCTNSQYGTVDNKTVLDSIDDAAAVKWGGKWHIPDYSEIEELVAQCTWIWTTQNGVNGCLVTGPNGNSIFLPAAGEFYNTSKVNVGNIVYNRGSKIPSTDKPSNTVAIGYISFLPLGPMNAMVVREVGYPIRPVFQPDLCTFLDYLGSAYIAEIHLEGDIIEEPVPPTANACSNDYEFVGWSKEKVLYGASSYNLVSFPYTMPNHAVTLYPVYRNKDVENLYTSFISCDDLGKIVEWYPTKLLLYTPYSQDAQFTLHINNIPQSVQIKNAGQNLIEISGIDIVANAGKRLIITCEANGKQYKLCHAIPVVVSRKSASIWHGTVTALDKSVYQYLDLVVRDSAIVAINGFVAACNTFNNIYIHPTAKIVVNNQRTLIVNSLSFWGGIDEIYNGSTYDLNKYGVPQLSLKNSKIQKNVETIDYIMRVDLDQMYQMGVPYDVELGDITYWDGSAIELGNELYVSAYDGQARANLCKKTWLWETEFIENKLKAGVGYTISAEPQALGDSYSILRLPMKKNIAYGATETDKTVNVFAYDNKNGVTITDNHKGWNYISNPYMTSISGGEADSKLVLGHLVETGTGPWEWVNDDIRYVTIPADNGKDYHQMKYSDAVLKPFKSYFVQIANEGELSFALASRQNAPARNMQAQTEQEIELEVLLANDQHSDNLGLLIAEQYSPTYEINADLEKMTGSMSVYTIYGGHQLAYNALNPANAEEWIPIGYIVPTAGEYTFHLDEKSMLDNVQHCYLMDYETSTVTDLMDNTYTFVSSTKNSDHRFAIKLVLSKENSNITTGVDNKKITTNQAHKFIYKGELYILTNGAIYNASGQLVKKVHK